MNEPLAVCFRRSYTERVVIEILSRMYSAIKLIRDKLTKKQGKAGRESEDWEGLNLINI